METKIKVAAVHAAPVFMDKKATTRKVVSLIEQAGEEGIKFLVFPETFIPGFPVNLSAVALPLLLKASKALTRLNI